MLQPTISIQIVNYKTKVYLEPLIESVVRDAKHSKLSVEILIADNASGDKLHDLAAKWPAETIHTYHLPKNVGFGAGHNYLAHHAKGQYLLLLNPDLVIIEGNTIERLIASAKEHKATVVGPRLLTPKLRQHTKLHTLARDQLKQQLWDHALKDRWTTYRPHDEPLEVAWVSGAVFLVDRQRFLDIGGFDEKFFMYYEEVDLCRRLKRHHAKVIYDPHINVLHYSGAVGRHWSGRMVRSFLRHQTKRVASIIKP